MIEIPLTPAGEDRPPPRLSKLAELLQDGVGVRSLVLTGLFLLAVLYTLFFAKEFLLPIFLAMMLTFLLVPVVRFFKVRLHLPEHLGAAIVMLGLVGILAGAVIFVSDPASNWLQTLPSKMPELETRLRLLKKPIAKVTAASAEVDKLATVSETSGGEIHLVQTPQKSIIAAIMSQTPAFVANLFVMLILLYFLLASGNSFLRKLVTMIPKLRDKVRAVEISRDIEEKISKYLRVTFTINVCLGLAVGTASYFVGLQNYILWGSLAFIFNFVPYIGALVGIVSILLVGLLTFATTSHAFVMPGIYLAIAVLEGNFITPMIMGRFMTLNPVAIFISLMFWGWIWGIPGALLAVPMLAIIKILCDHVESLEPIGEFLGS